MKYLAFFVFLFSFFSLAAQVDSVPYSRDFEFREGIFLTLEKFKSNEPIPKSSIITSIPPSDHDFMDQVMTFKTITYKDVEGNEQKLETATCWGYCQNRTIYMNFNKEFHRVNVIGRLFHMVATVTTMSGVRDPMDYNYAINNSFDELRQFTFDTDSNKLFDFNVKSMEIILQRDPELYAEFMKLSKKKKADSIFIYLRKYNEKHPLLLSNK